MKSIFFMYFITFIIHSQKFLKKYSKIGHGAASIQKRPLIKKNYFNPYFFGLYLRAAINGAATVVLILVFEYIVQNGAKNKCTQMFTYYF